MPAGFVTFRDKRFSIAYPATWTRRRAPGVPLLAATGDTTGSFLVRTVPLRAEVNHGNLAQAKPLTDRVVGSGQRVSLLAQPQQGNLGGLPTLFYLYTFDDPQTRQRGAHSHYFIFKGTTMFTIVFQALPADRLSAFAPVFDQIAGTFRPT